MLKNVFLESFVKINGLVSKKSLIMSTRVAPDHGSYEYYILNKYQFYSTKVATLFIVAISASIDGAID